MKPAIRLAAMMGLPVKYVFTHDDFRVGEDGPTHQPVEHELQLRLLEKITKNGFPTLLVFRPADAFETQQAWSVALKYESVPTVFIFSRQNVPQLQLVGNVDKGAYVVNCEPGATVTLIANGSDVHLAIGVAHLLSLCDVKCSVVSVPSIGLFLQQPKEYQDYVIPSDELRYGITSGLALNLLELVKDPDCIFSMKTFGASAPVQQLEKEFGFMPQNICDRILKRVK
jgi:transketolase